MYAAITPVGTMTTKGQIKRMNSKMLFRNLLGILLGFLLLGFFYHQRNEEHKETKQVETEMSFSRPVGVANDTDSITSKQHDELIEAIDLMIKDSTDEE